jgi:hypothetical protein
MLRNAMHDDDARAGYWVRRAERKDGNIVAPINALIFPYRSSIRNLIVTRRAVNLSNDFLSKGSNLPLRLAILLIVDFHFSKATPRSQANNFCPFREFYYIQMEKYARQAVSEGVKNVEDLQVGGDSEIYRVLNLHYNRNNHIEVWNPQVRNYTEHAHAHFLLLFAA